MKTFLLLLLTTSVCFADTPPPQTVFSKTEDYLGNGITSTVSGAKRGLDVNVLSSSTGHSKVNLVRNVYSSTNVTTGAYVQLIASTADIVNSLNIFDSSGQTLVLAVGGVGVEVDQIYITPGGNGNMGLNIPAGSRVSIKAVSATANVGELDLSLLK